MLIERTAWTDRLLHQRPLIAVLSIAAAALLALYLFNLQSTAKPTAIELTRGEASVAFYGDRLLLPGICVGVRWQVDGIREVYLNDVGVVGSGTRESCIPDAPKLTVVFGDGVREEYTLDVAHLSDDPAVALVLAACVVLVGIGALLLLGAPGLIVVLTVALFAPLLRWYANTGGDYITHQFFAQQALETGQWSALPPHFVYHGFILGVSALTGIDLENASFWVVLVAQIATALGVFVLLRLIVRREGDGLRAQVIDALLTVGLLIVASLAIANPWFPVASRPLLAPPNTYHSPTMVFSRAFSVWLFVAFMAALRREDRAGGRWLASLVVIALLTVVGTLSKPNYTLALAPVCALLIAYGIWRRQSIARLALLAGVIVPAALVLIGQYAFLYGPGAQSTVYGQQASITLAPLALTETYHLPAWWLPVEIALSALFPAAVYLLFPESRRDLSFNMAWLAFGVAVATSLLFVEMPRATDANLTWGNQATLLIAFAVAAGWWLRAARRIDWRWLLAAGILAAHLLAGLTWTLHP
ncbi:MAG: hypothetical protein IT320_02725 [Anaerolineae bacterium]|nr:hypothetical protein [Anaerolineae bacterium]